MRKSTPKNQLPLRWITDKWSIDQTDYELQATHILQFYFLLYVGSTFLALVVRVLFDEYFHRQSKSVQSFQQDFTTPSRHLNPTSHCAELSKDSLHIGILLWFLNLIFKAKTLIAIINTLEVSRSKLSLFLKKKISYFFTFITFFCLHFPHLNFFWINFFLSLLSIFYFSYFSHSFFSHFSTSTLEM